MLFYWLGIYFLAALGLFLYPVYGVDSFRMWPVVLGVGILFNTIGYFRKELDNTPSARGKLWLLLIPLTFGIYAFRFPYNLPFYLVGAGIILSFFSQNKMARALSAGIILSGLVVGLQTALVIPYYKLASRYHEANFITPLFYWILKGLGISCAHSQGTLFIHTPREVLSLVISWEKLGLYFFLTFLTGALMLIYFAADDEKRMMKLRSSGVLIISLIIYSIIRYVFLFVVYSDIGREEVFWEPVIVACSYLPLPFLLTKLICLNGDMKVPFPAINLSRNSLYAGITSFLFFCALAGYCWFSDPGRIKKGRILFDEHYSNWEWTERKLDTEWFGIQSVYNYYCFADYLSHFYSVGTLKKVVTDELLAQYDVFIVKTPTTFFSDSEIESIVTFVRKGGGLFLIGDHTNVFGTTININPLAERFGIKFNYDAIYDLRTSDLHFYTHNTPFRHPVVQEMPYFLFATSCSLSAPLSAEDVITASNLKAIYLDYSRGGFFPDKAKEKDYAFGLFLQSVGIKHGKGRVLAFSDSTCFSNFYMYIPGKPEYALGSINWLNRMNCYDRPVKLFCIFIMIISLGFLCHMIFRAETDGKVNSSSFGVAVLCGGIFGLSAGSLFLTSLTQITYTLPRGHPQMKRVGFENNYCNFQVPAKRFLHNPSTDFHTFYVWTQRLGYVPTLFSLEDSLDRFDIAVFINPEGVFSETNIKKIEDYVTKGGGPLVIDSPRRKGSTASQLLERFGIKVLHDQYQQEAEIYDDSQSIGVIKSFAPIEGGEPLLFSKDRKSLLSLVKRGKGMLAVMACSPTFTNEEMGKTESVPDEHQRFIYKLEFWVLTGLMEKHFKPFTGFNF